VFSDHANDSEHVGHVVANAFALGLAVIPLRIEAVNPKDHLAYFLETVLVLVSVGVILVSMAEITWDLASRFTIRPGQPAH
jgi:hypothetical protein